MIDLCEGCPCREGCILFDECARAPAPAGALDPARVRASMDRISKRWPWSCSECDAPAGEPCDEGCSRAELPRDPPRSGYLQPVVPCPSCSCPPICQLGGCERTSR